MRSTEPQNAWEARLNYPQYRTPKYLEVPGALTVSNPEIPKVPGVHSFEPQSSASAEVFAGQKPDKFRWHSQYSRVSPKCLKYRSIQEPLLARTPHIRRCTSHHTDNSDTLSTDAAVLAGPETPASTVTALEIERNGRPCAVSCS